MGLKGYRLWDMGQLDSTCRAPPWLATPTSRRAASRLAGRPPPPRKIYKLGIRKQALKQSFHLIGESVDETGRFRAMGLAIRCNVYSPPTAGSRLPPRRPPSPKYARASHPLAGIIPSGAPAM
jgi:hypothetical protein